jgi:RNA polymerase primary sigma factor
MLRVNYAFRDDVKTITLLTQGIVPACPLCQIVTLRKREIAPEFVDEYIALDIKKGTFPVTAISEYGKSILTNHKYERCVLRIDSQIEFTVKPRTMERIGEFFPAYNAGELYHFFEGQPTGFLVVLKVFAGQTSIPRHLMLKGRQGSAQIMQLYDEFGEKTFIDVSLNIQPVVEQGLFEYIKDEILHSLRLENSLIGIYGSDDEGKKLLQQKRDVYNKNIGQSKHTFNEDDDVDRSILDYDDIFYRAVCLDPNIEPFINYIKGIKAPQMIECQTLMPKAQLGDRKAYKRIIEMYMRNVIRIALYYSERYNLPISDTIQDGMVGLTYSIKKFDNSSADLFTRYFPLWVRQNILRESTKYGNLLYFPVHIYTKLQTVQDIIAEHGILIEDAFDCLYEIIPHVVEAMGISEKTARRYITYLQPIFSLDEIIGAENETEFFLSSIILEDFEEDMLYEIFRKDLSKIIDSILKKMTLRKAEVIKMRYGFNEGKPMTLEEIGNQMGLTRERIRQIEAKAIEKFKHSTRSRLLKDYYV